MKGGTRTDEKTSFGGSRKINQRRKVGHGITKQELFLRFPLAKFLISLVPPGNEF